VKTGELLRVRLAFGALAAVPVFLAGWLGWVQVLQAGEIEREGRSPLRLLPATADSQGRRIEAVPAPRGTIVDRHGKLLALDCQTYDVRANLVVPAKVAAEVNGLRAWIATFVQDVSLALVADPELADRGDVRARHVRRLGELLADAFRTGDLPAAGKLPVGHPRRAEVLLAGGVDVLSVVEALRKLADDPRYRDCAFHFLRNHRREHPERDQTYGIVGHVTTKWVPAKEGSGKVLETSGACGLETFPVLDAERGSFRSFLSDGRGRPYFQAPVAQVPVANVLHSTLDLELQRVAMHELSAYAEAGARDGQVKVPKWGALVLVEIATGDVLAAASWHRDVKNPEAAAFTPYQNIFEPGSIVKPLVLAYAHEAGALDWGHVFDCASGSAEYRERIAPLGRRKAVVDDHPCGALTPHEILINSSNIGAAYCGLLLEREQWRDYMRFYGFGESLGLQMPFEGKGGTNAKSFDPKTPIRSFRANSAISFSFGYEMQANAMQLLRAYLRLFRGGGAQLRVCRGVELDGEFHAAPVPDPSPRMRPEVVDGVRAALVDVISADPHATGVYLHTRMLKELGIDLHGVIAGKTGTAASRVGVGDKLVEMRNASFVGFLPVEQPRWLAICVMQKDSRSSFYGGSYAAPPVVRLLLQCQDLERRRLLRQDAEAGGQTRLRDETPGDSGWSRRAPGTTAVGR
jgi:cell division protein FtsI/penicillin-binding protein 2